MLNWQRKVWQQPAPDTITNRRYRQPRFQPPTTPSHSRRRKRNGSCWKNSWPIPGAELAQLTQARASDQAELVAEQARINELSEQLKTATTNIDMERQLASAGKDVRDLMGARQFMWWTFAILIPTGRPVKLSAVCFLRKGKSLIFYAFDLTDAKKINAKQTFQVWGQQEGKTSSLRSLGFLYVDDKAQRRWALKTEDAAAVKEIDSVFVTVEPEGGAKKPSSQRLLYAYLGEANHP